MALQFARIQNLIDNARNGVTDFLWHQQFTELPWWKRTLIRSCQILIAVMRDIFQGQLSLRAMSLVFTTVVGFFPLLALTFSVLKSLGIHNAMEPTLEALLEPLGDRSEELTAQFLGYVDNLQVELIGITSVGLLLYIVLDMMRKIESSFNFIWAVRQGRSWASRISEYLFAVIVSPLLLFLSIGITSYVNTNFFQRLLENLTYGGVIIEATAVVAPILLMSLAFAFAYGFLPNTRVQFSSAFLGGLVTTIIWKLMGSVFQGVFVTSARESIYLAFFTAIAIMFFIYIGWLVALIGSSIAFYHQNPAKTRTGREPIQLSISQQERFCLAVAALIIRRFSRGEAALYEEQITAELNAAPMAVEFALDTLEEIGLIIKTDESPTRYLPTRSVSNCTLVSIWKLLRSYNDDSFADATESTELNQISNFQHELDATVERELGNRKFAEAMTAMDSASVTPIDAGKKNID